MKEKRGSSFIESTFVLMVASIVVKLIGAFYSIPLTNLYGAAGTGIFNVAYYVYTTMFIISTAGLPVAVSRMVAASNTLGRGREVRRIGRIAFISFTVIGLFFSAVIFFGADLFVTLAGLPSARFAVLAISPCIFFVALVSAIRGYYQGLANMVPTAWSQVIEALGKLIFGLGLAYYLMDRGYSLDIVVAGAIGGVTIGTVLGAIYIIIVRIRDIRRGDVAVNCLTNESRSSKELTRALFAIAVPITLSAGVLSLTNLIDTFLVVRRLQEAGMTSPEAGTLYGAYGMAVKFFNLPQTIIVGIGTSVLPAISAALARRSREQASRLTESSFRLTALLALPCAVGLAVLPQPIMDLLYYQQPEDVLVAAPTLTLLGPAVVFVAMQSVSNAILQAQGKEKLPVVSMAIGGAVKLITNYTLIAIPAINIRGAPIGTSLCYGTITVLNLIFIRHYGIPFSFTKTFLKPLISAGVMGVFAYLMYPPVSGVIGSKLGVLAVIALSAVLYLLMLIATRALPKEDILMLPKGEKIAKILRVK